VFEDPDFHWAVGMIQDKADPFFSGTPISLENESRLREIGIQAYGVFRLESELSPPEGSKKFGTLSFFHRHPRRFSWRDVALAKALSQRAADLVALHNQNSRLLKTRDELIEANRKLRTVYEKLQLESRILTRVEVVSLLAHDLGHKAIRAETVAERFIKDAAKALREDRQFGSIVNEADRLLEATRAVKVGLFSVNQLFHHGANLPTDEVFGLKSVIEEVFRTLEEPLQRNDMTASVNVPDSIRLHGNKDILLQVLFNLVINSIDAQKMRRNPRQNTIHVHAASESGDGDRSTIVIKFWDEGPGVNQSIFPDPNDIFELGTTSKPEGTGRGLPISRNLLNVYFGADMSIVDPRSAHFRIRIPTGTRR
jgi:signal transduction histidine kinase